MPRTTPAGSSLYATCFMPDGTTFDMGSFAERLLVFERYILHSAQLREIEPIVRAVGYEALCDLIERGVLGIVADADSLACPAPLDGEQVRGEHRIIRVRMTGHSEAVSTWLQQIMSINGLTHREARRLKSIVGTHVRPWPEGDQQTALNNLRHDLSTKPRLIQAALSQAVQQELGATTDPESLIITVEQVRDGTYRINSDVGSRLNVDHANVFRVHQATLLGIAGLNHMIEGADVFRAMPAMRERDLLLLRHKAGLFGDLVAEAQRQQELSRIQELVGVPDLGAAALAGTLDFAKLLQLRDTDEARAFRDWLTRASTMSDQEVLAANGNLRAIARFLDAPGIGILKFLCTLGVNLAVAAVVPMAAEHPDKVAGAVDAIGWYLGTLLPKGGPACFVSEHVRPLVSA